MPQTHTAEPILLPRLRYRGRPLMKLTIDQRAAIVRFNQACRTGAYTFEEVNCLCGQSVDSALLIAAQDRYGLDHRVYLCRRCGLVWNSPRLDDRSLLQFYQHDYRPIYDGTPLPSEEGLARDYSRGEGVYNYLKDLFPNKTQKTVLEIGCGTGSTLRVFQKHGWQVAGCDYNDSYFDREAATTLNLRQGSATSLSSFAPVDLIIAAHVVEHLRDPVDELEQWRKLLTNQGLLYVRVPGIPLSPRPKFDFGRTLQNAHLYYFSLPTITATVARAGFTFVQGDDEVMAVYKRGPKASKLTNNPQEAVRVVKYLRRAELKHKLRKPVYETRRALARALGR